MENKIKITPNLELFTKASQEIENLRNENSILKVKITELVEENHKIKENLENSSAKFSQKENNFLNEKTEFLSKITIFEEKIRHSENLVHDLQIENDKKYIFPRCKVL